MSSQLARSILILCCCSLCLVSCNRQESQPEPTVVPTAVLPSPTAIPPSPTAVPATATSPILLAEYMPVYEEAPCESILTPEAVGTLVGVNIQCGFLTVLEDREGDAKDTLRLAVAHISSRTPTADAVPLVFLPGGPGSPILSHLADFNQQFAGPLSDGRAIILFDPRGVGFSEPQLDCWELKATYLQDLGQQFPAAERADNYKEALFTCRDRLQASDANLGMYHSATMAADVKDLLQALGYKQADLLAVSYGTRLAQQLMQDYPDLVRSVVLDSVVPIDNEFIPETADWQGAALQALFAACASQPDCQAAYPDLEAVYNELQTTLAEEPVAIMITDPVQGNVIEIMADHAALNNALQWALPNSALAPLIPQMLYSLRDGDGMLLGSVLTLPLLTYGDMSLGMMISVLCHDQVFTLSPEQLVAGARSHPHLGLLNVVAAYEDGRFLLDLCQQWGAAEPEPGANEPLNSVIPTLILAGERDTTTPPAFGRHLAQGLEHSYFVELPNEGHVPTFGPAADCIQEMIRAFLDNPEVEPDLSCPNERSQASFFIPYNGGEEIGLTPWTADDLPFTIMTPADWQAGEYNHFYWLRFPGDSAQLVVQASSISIEEWLSFLMDNYAGVGLEERPEYVEETMINDRPWQIYTTSFHDQPVTFAFTHEAGTTYQINIASINQEHTSLYENLFLPVLTSLNTK